MPKAKPVSLFPLSFDEAIKVVMRVDPARVGLGPKRVKRKRQRNTKQRDGKR